MAYALFEQNVGFLQKIASDDTHLAYIKHSHPLSIQKTITVGTVMIKRMCTENVTLGQIIHLLEVYIYK